MNNLRYVDAIPGIEAFYPLFMTTGWNERLGLTRDALATALAGSFYGVCAYDGDTLVAAGRLLSDGAYQCFLCDLIVHPDHQGRGIGKELVRRLLGHAKSHGIRWMQLTSARGKRGFYEKLGFTARSEEAPGMDIWL